MEKVHRTKSKGNKAQASKTIILVDSHRTCLIPAATGRYNACEILSTQKIAGESITKVFIRSWCLAYTKILES